MLFAQGDILLVPEKAPRNFECKGASEVIVGYGEANGHVHVVQGTRVQWLMDVCDEVTLERVRPSCEADVALYVRVEGDAGIHHLKHGKPTTDHDAIDLPDGDYRVVRQRQATADSVRAVWD